MAGFSLHAGTACEAYQRSCLERLCRYITRPPVAAWLGVDSDWSGRAKVEPDLSVPGHPDISVIGDAASVTGPDGDRVPGIAPAAKQEGPYVARLITGGRGRRPQA